MSGAFQQRPTAIVTGANTGIGLVTACELAARGYRVFATCRSREKGAATLEHIAERTGREADFLQLDLADFESIRGAAATFLQAGEPLSLLVNNAGVARLRGLTEAGFENTFAINHLGPFLLTNLLLPRMSESGPARIVTVSSEAHYYARGVPWNRVRQTTSYNGFREYAVSKLANILFSRELARRLAGTNITTYALHPGRIATDVWRHAPRVLKFAVNKWMDTPDAGARTTLYCATSPDVAQESGLYYDRSSVQEPSRAARDAGLAAELWQRSAEWVRAQTLNPARACGV